MRVPKRHPEIYDGSRSAIQSVVRRRSGLSRQFTTLFTPYCRLSLLVVGTRLRVDRSPKSDQPTTAVRC